MAAKAKNKVVGIHKDLHAAKMLEACAKDLREGKAVEFIFASRVKRDKDHPDIENGNYDIYSIWYSELNSTIAILGLLGWITHSVQHYLDDE